MKFISTEEIKSLHLEITSHCNVKCPLCDRTKYPNFFDLGQLTVDDIKKFFPPSFTKRLELVHLCGNYGEPILAKDCFDIIKYFHDLDTRITMHTHGSARSPVWWKELGSLKTKGSVTFNIDGLEDTNHMYRIGSTWSKIMENAESFISAGGQAEWAFITFRHNEHQVKEARELSKNMGFKAFKIRRNTRMIPKELINVYEQPLGDFSKEETNSWQVDNFDTVQCQIFPDRSIYCTYEGEVWPCCFIAPSSIRRKTGSMKIGERFDSYFNEDPYFNSLFHNSLEKILKHRWIHELPATWHTEEKTFCRARCGNKTKMLKKYGEIK